MLNRPDILQQILFVADWWRSHMGNYPLVVYIAYLTQQLFVIDTVQDDIVTPDFPQNRRVSRIVFAVHDRYTQYPLRTVFENGLHGMQPENGIISGATHASAA